jgi:VanZ family protein
MRLANVTGWILLFAIAAISIVPPELRPVTILPHDLEHAAIYFLAGCAFGISRPYDFVASLGGLIAFTLVVEVTQSWIPDRHARVSDFLVDAFAISMGLVVSAMFARLMQRCPRN